MRELYGAHLLFIDTIFFDQAIPISNFISRCEAKWVMMLSQKQQDTEMVGRKHCLDNFICEGISNCGMIRRIISSEDLGFVLMGTLKVCRNAVMQMLIMH